jgi:hypothetical protein
MGRSYTPLPPSAFMACSRTAFNNTIMWLLEYSDCKGKVCKVLAVVWNEGRAGKRTIVSTAFRFPRQNTNSREERISLVIVAMRAILECMFSVADFACLCNRVFMWKQVTINDKPLVTRTTWPSFVRTLNSYWPPPPLYLNSSCFIYNTIIKSKTYHYVYIG